MKSTQGVAR